MVIYNHKYIQQIMLKYEGNWDEKDRRRKFKKDI